MSSTKGDGMALMAELAGQRSNALGSLPDEYGLHVRVVEITPDLAGSWLQTNEGNRNPKRSNIERYARDMENGHWSLTGEALIFDSVGTLRNGQNRLLACIKSGEPFTSLVVWGPEPSSFDNMDRGAARTIGDVFGIRGEGNAHALAAACGYVWREEHGKSLFGGGKTTPTSSEAEDVLRRNPGLRDSLHWRNGAARVGIPSPAFAVYVHYRISQIDVEAANMFFQSLYTGEGLYRGNPVLTLSKALDRKDRLDIRVANFYILKAWNAYAEGRDLMMLKWGENEQVPTPVKVSSRRWM